MNEKLSGPPAWALTGLQIVIALVFLGSGGAKLVGQAEMVDVFDKIGWGQWFRYVTGVLEVGGAVGLLIPAAAPFAAVTLCCVMVGAVGTHLFLIGGSPAAAAVLLVLCLAIVWFRRATLLKLLR